MTDSNDKGKIAEAVVRILVQDITTALNYRTKDCGMTDLMATIEEFENKPAYVQRVLGVLSTGQDGEGNEVIPQEKILRCAAEMRGNVYLYDKVFDQLRINGFRYGFDGDDVLTKDKMLESGLVSQEPKANGGMYFLNFPALHQALEGRNLSAPCRESSSGRTA